MANDRVRTTCGEDERVAAARHLSVAPARNYQAVTVSLGLGLLIVAGACLGDEPPRLTAQATFGPRVFGFGMSFSPDGKLLATSSSSESHYYAVRLWDVAAGKLHAVLPEEPTGMAGYLFSPDGRSLVTGGYQVKIWDVISTEQIGALPSGAAMLAFLADASLLMVVDPRSRSDVGMWDLRTLRKVGALKGHFGRIDCLALSADGKMAATGGGEGSVRVWNLAQRQARLVLRGHQIQGAPVRVNGLALAPDSKTLVSTGSDNMVRFWDLKTGEEKDSFGGIGHFTPLCVAYSPDGKLLAISWSNGRVVLYDAQDLREKARLDEKKVVDSLAFSPDGKVLATSGHDLTVKLWDLTKLPANKPER